MLDHSDSSWEMGGRGASLETVTNLLQSVIKGEVMRARLAQWPWGWKYKTRHQCEK